MQFMLRNMTDYPSASPMFMLRNSYPFQRRNIVRKKTIHNSQFGFPGLRRRIRLDQAVFLSGRRCLNRQFHVLDGV